ncbi:uncharacterized protein LOC132934828 [Metopolophium dirhodum]|uniref:uncharacterized protein LOC132934828 n=1 Tax=Metopolophium dirhodum TaxID=44670 RepID=UPI00298F788D|nr:uncharacterized protein LOC132934828 [Metopolophium dirhodum]
MNCDTAYGMWNKLLSVYEQMSDTSITIVQQKFYRYTMDPKDNIAGHISKLENLSRQLKQLGEPISESMLITKILMTLPDSYRHFYSAWDSMNSTNRTLEQLTTRLMVEETRQVQGQEVRNDGAESIALTANKAISAAEQLQLRQFDVQTAFLYGDLDEEIYMRQPEGFNDGTEMVCRLQRSLYGLKQSPRCELLDQPKTVPTMYGDNQSAIKLVKNPEFHRRTKHIDVRYHYIREKFNEGLFSLEYISSKEQIADIMTKPTPRTRFNELREMLGVINIDV